MNIFINILFHTVWNYDWPNTILNGDNYLGPSQSYSQRNCMGSPCICDMLPYDWKGETPIIPQTINVGPYNIKVVYQYIPNRTRCFQCQIFGHGKQSCRVCVGLMVFYATFNNNISVVSSRSVLLMGETGVPGENYPPAASHWQSNRQYNIIKKVEHYIYLNVKCDKKKLKLSMNIHRKRRPRWLNELGSWIT